MSDILDLNFVATDVIYDNTYQEQQMQCNNDSDISEDSNCEGFDLELKPLKPIIEKLLKIVVLFSMSPTKNDFLPDLTSNDKSIGKPRS